MHEIAGPILFVLETELKAFTDYYASHPDAPTTFKTVFTNSALEAHTFWIFEKIMDELEPLYDPTGKSSSYTVL
jgi:hypothetical protein